jgi:hypothetical protein
VIRLGGSNCAVSCFGGDFMPMLWGIPPIGRH